MAVSQLYEVVGNIHIHTPYSDGTGDHDAIIRAAAEAQLDFVITTDHNVLVQGVEGIYTHNGHDVLLIMGEELHNPRLNPFGDHLLALGANEEFAHQAGNPQQLIDSIIEANGLSFIAHPYDKAIKKWNMPSYAWRNWDIKGFTGIELWNYMSEFKENLGSTLSSVRALSAPERVINGPSTETLTLWDDLLSLENRVVAIGGSDAHAFQAQWGPIKQTIFPYKQLFQGINNHVLLHTPLSGDFDNDKKRILETIAAGRLWIGNDQLAPTKRFRFSAQGHNFTAAMGGQIRVNYGVTLQVGTPQLSTIRLIHNGILHTEEDGIANRSFIVNQPGVYRVEVYLPVGNKQRGWIFTNPIFVF